jgi:hypothetical protein
MNKTFATFAVLAAFTAMPQLSRAADEIAYNAASDQGYAPVTCAEASQSAWLNRQMQITDGDVSPAVPQPSECASADYRVLASTDEAR